MNAIEVIIFMAEDFGSARFWARALLESAVFPGARAIDATMGNGHDTLWLCTRVGPAGHVYAFDVQEEACSRTRARLEAAGMNARASLFLAGHEEMNAHVGEPVDAVVFNLGWLPGGAREVTTRVETTLQAIDAATRLIKPTGLVTICVYPGHEEGKRELAVLMDRAATLDPVRYDVMSQRYLNQKNDPPALIAIRKRP